MKVLTTLLAGQLFVFSYKRQGQDILIKQWIFNNYRDTIFWLNIQPCWINGYFRLK